MPFLAVVPYCHVFAYKLSFRNSFLYSKQQWSRRASPSSPQTSRSSLSMISSIKIRIVGKKNGGDAWLNDAYSTYETRLRGSIDVETIWHKNDPELVTSVMVDQKKGHSVVLLDPQGKMCSSEQFSEQLYSWFDDGGSRISFVIGGADGLPSELKSSVFTKGGGLASLSLSSMTMTHQFSRVLLIEQIYRASEIRKGARVKHC